ncbi:tubby C-terminal domain-like protein [Viridibacillus sp. NPDC093762]|uniref:tubby C-terminal domain-like protein n=1 Tax=Viridibacillus sp. NPDC093762 TaxID=3390720 RepID=UPI003D07A5F7
MYTYSYEIPKHMSMQNRLPLTDEYGNVHCYIKKRKPRKLTRIVNNLFSLTLNYCFEAVDRNEKIIYSISALKFKLDYKLTTPFQKIVLQRMREQLIESKYTWQYNSDTYVFLQHYSLEVRLFKNDEEIATLKLLDTRNSDELDNVSITLLKEDDANLAALMAVLYHSLYYYNRYDSTLLGTSISLLDAI